MRVLLIGTSAATYRGYLLRSLARRHDVWLFSERDLTWEEPYLAGSTRVDTTDVAAMLAAARGVAAQAVLTWDDDRVVQTAAVADGLGLHGATAAAAGRCRDKHATRTALAAAGVPQATSLPVASLREARAAAATLGYPLVLKPRALNASQGVVRVDAPDQLAARFRIALAGGSGVLVEEYLDGPEISVDAFWTRGRGTVAFVAHKELGFPPYFEEVGHLVDGADPLAADRDVAELLRAAHAAVGFDTGWTHTELRLTPTGPRVVEINARMGGDRIPEVAALALGLDPAALAAAVAAGQEPPLRPTRRRVAAVRFLYPDRNVIARAVHVDAARLPAGVVTVDPIARPGQELRLPPDGHVSSRYALITAVADTAAQVLADLDAAAGAVHLEIVGAGFPVARAASPHR